MSRYWPIMASIIGTSQWKKWEAEDSPTNKKNGAEKELRLSTAALLVWIIPAHREALGKKLRYVRYILQN
jgi:hypothetical protein